jgi:hypothetical protein
MQCDQLERNHAECEAAEKQSEEWGLRSESRREWNARKKTFDRIHDGHEGKPCPDSTLL